LSLRQSLGLVTRVEELANHPVALAFGALAVIGVWRLTILQRRQMAALEDREA
jgi:hypothetical protein